MYKRVRLRRTPEQLGLPAEDWTKERSRSKWLEWLQAAIQKIDLKEEIKKPTQKPKVPYKRRSRKKLVDWRDDPDYPKEDSEGLGPEELRQYHETLNAINSEETSILEGLRTESRTAAEFQEYLDLLKRICGVRRTLDDRRHYNLFAGRLLMSLNWINEVRPYANTTNDIHKEIQRLLGRRWTLKTTDEINEFVSDVVTLNGTVLCILNSPLGELPPITVYRGWEGPPRYRWSKMQNKKRFRVTCNELGLPKEHWTAKDSQKAWLKWLHDKLNSADQSIGKLAIPSEKSR